MIQTVLGPRKKLFRSCASPDSCIDSETSLLKVLQAQPVWALIVVTIKDHYLFNNLYGDGLVHELEEALTLSLLTAAREETGQEQTYCFQPNSGELLLLWPGIGSAMTRLPDTTYAIKLKAQSALKQVMLQKTGREVELDMGCAPISLNRVADVEREFLHSVQEARRNAQARINISRLELANVFKEILKTRCISAAYQPIMDFASGTIHGWEALARGPAESSFRSPIMLFEMAEKLERLFQLEEICRERAIADLGPIGQDQKLFLNIHPKTMADPNFTPGKTLRLLESAGLSPDNVVFEITERHSIQNFDLFYRALEHYRSQGFKVAVDDTGSGYSGLTTIAELQPDYIKLDKDLVQGVDRDPVKRALLETFVSFADKIGSKIIAEGIETKAQATCLVDMNVHLGQGYYLARPANPRPTLSIDPQKLKPITDIAREGMSCSIPVGKIADAPHPVEPGYLACDARTFFEEDGHASNLVVCKDEAPVGLVMEYHLNRQLTTQFGMALYYKRPVENVMDPRPLVVEYGTPVEQAAKLAMEREPLKAYDDLVVVRGGKLFGVITVQRLMNTLAQVQVEMAKGTNPLSGLPGNVALEKEIEQRIASNAPCDIIYADLDHFKVYNDTYGFRNGDLIIKLAADILAWAVRRHGGKDARLFHIGGDDFVVVCRPETSERISLGTVRCFKRLVRECYCNEDRARGWVMAKGRDGKQARFPLVSISLGILGVYSETSLKEIGEQAAHLKKYAKSIPGNGYVRDRRSKAHLQAKHHPGGCPSADKDPEETVSPGKGAGKTGLGGRYSWVVAEAKGAAGAEGGPNAENTCPSGAPSA
jgi:diguanylate cyclase (GGDEF)-like protein